VSAHQALTRKFTPKLQHRRGQGQGQGKGENQRRSVQKKGLPDLLVDEDPVEGERGMMRGSHIGYLLQNLWWGTAVATGGGQPSRCAHGQTSRGPPSSLT
jgi:hypothetical protein